MYLTKNGGAMKEATRLKILQIMTNPAHEGKTQKALAKLVGVDRTTLSNYLTDAMWEDIEKLRLDVVTRQLEMVDKAVYAKAIQGDLTAAKLIYGRWQNLEETHKKSIEDETEMEQGLKEADEEIKRLRTEIRQLEQQFGLL